MLVQDVEADPQFQWIQRSQKESIGGCVYWGSSVQLNICETCRVGAHCDNEVNQPLIISSPVKIKDLLLQFQNKLKGHGCTCRDGITNDQSSQRQCTHQSNIFCIYTACSSVAHPLIMYTRHKQYMSATHVVTCHFIWRLTWFLTGRESSNSKNPFKEKV